ncbi:MAG: cobalamin-dependent protein [Desulfobacterales bacterium]|nr:cobalamin-dependent protein [Desulfobacterales bacterium]
MMNDAPHILLINPWIEDFAAYDYWAKPLGLLLLASILEAHGCRVSYLDCLDRFHPRAPRSDPYARNGRGPYLKTRIPRPKGFEDIPRFFSRYGIREEWFREDLSSVTRPDLIGLTCLMTYWYPGLQKTVDVVRDYFPDVPAALGGIYATLCHAHAKKHSGADIVVRGPGEHVILNLVSKVTGARLERTFDPEDLDSYPYPAFHLQRKINYVPLLTSKGCPFSCAYCASRFLHPTRLMRSPGSVVEEIRFWHEKYGVADFIFYDDALLMDAETHAVPLFEKIIGSGMKIRFHTPNAIHIRGISMGTARLMRQAGFETLRLGLETTWFEDRKDLDNKVNAREFKQAVGCLVRAGFEKSQVGAYLLAGLPGQSMDTLAASVQAVVASGITPVLAHYSPIPHTALWDKAVSCSRYDLASDPIFTNNTAAPCQAEPVSWETISSLKRLVAM